MSTSALLLFAKHPLPGAVKTRLIPRLGAGGAAAFAEACLLDLLERLAAADLGEGVRRVLCYAPEGAREAFMGLLQGGAWGETWTLAPQGGGDLGQRLKRAWLEARDKGAAAAAFIGMDAPDLPSEVIRSALRGAARGQAILHPAPDGGYVLLALPRQAPGEVFDGIRWSSDETGAQQVRRIRERGLEIEISESFPDVDEPSALAPLLRRLQEQPRLCPRTLRVLSALP